MKSPRDETHSMKKASEAEVDNTSASLSKAGPSKQPDPTIQTSDPTIRASDDLDAQPMVMDLMVLPFHQSSLKVFSPTMAPRTQIFNPTTRIFIPSTQKSLRGCVPKLRSVRTRKNKRFGQNTILSHLQRKISPLSLSRSLLNLNRLLDMINNRIAQTQFLQGGRYV